MEPDNPNPIPEQEESEDWRKNVHSMEDLNLTLFQRQINPDFGIQLNGTWLFLHKYILYLNSESFVTNIPVVGTSGYIMPPNLFSSFEELSLFEFVKFLYTHKLSTGLSFKTLLEIYCFAEVFSVNRCLKPTLIELRRLDSHSINWWTCLKEMESLSGKFEALKPFLMELLTKVPKDWQSNEEFLNMEIAQLITFLSYNELGATPIQKFSAMIKWAEACCERKGSAVTVDNMRLELKDAVGCVGYNEMTMTELGIVLGTGIFTDQEARSLVWFNTQAIYGDEFVPTSLLRKN